MKIIENCPKCGSENIQLMSRVTGYMQNIDGWNKGKRQELVERYRYQDAFKGGMAK